MEIKYENGFLYPIYKQSIELLKRGNAVEYYKKLVVYIGKKKGQISKAETDRNERIGTDIFIVSKWLLIILFWIFNFKGPCTLVITWYLIGTNIYTYFYYHIWSDSSLNKKRDWDAIKRRFFNLLLAISFSEFCFAYLYTHHYLSQFNYSTESNYVVQSFWFSISNSLAANYDNVKIVTPLGYSITMIQLVITFAFVTIILGNSIPQTDEINNQLEK